MILSVVPGPPYQTFPSSSRALIARNSRVYDVNAIVIAEFANMESRLDGLVTTRNHELCRDRALTVHVGRHTCERIVIGRIKRQVEGVYGLLRRPFALSPSGAATTTAATTEAPPKVMIATTTPSTSTDNFVSIWSPRSTLSLTFTLPLRTSSRPRHCP